MLRHIVVEAETLDDSRTMFRLRIDGSVFAEGVTEEQAHILVAEILERIPSQDVGSKEQRRATLRQ